MVREHRGHTLSEATQNPCKFFTSLGQSKNPEIQYFQKPHKNFKVLIKRFLLGSFMIYLDFWIIGLFLTWRDYETKSRATLLSAPINRIKCQCNRGRDWSVATQILSKWSGPMEKVEMAFYLITAIHQLRPKWDTTKR